MLLRTEECSLAAWSNITLSHEDPGTDLDRNVRFSYLELQDVFLQMEVKELQCGQQLLSLSGNFHDLELAILEFEQEMKVLNEVKNHLAYFHFQDDDQVSVFFFKDFVLRLYDCS